MRGSIGLDSSTMKAPEEKATLFHHLNNTSLGALKRTLAALAILVMVCSLVGCRKAAPIAQQPTPTCCKTPKPTFTSVALARAVPTSTAVQTKGLPISTQTLTAMPSDTPKPTLEPSATPTASPSATPTQEPTVVIQKPTAKPATVAAPAASSAGAMAAKPKGSSLAYQPEFPAVAPAGEPPTFDAHTNPLSGQHVDDPAKLQRRPILVRYGNDHAARPPAGVSDAEVVMEDLMDAWWITRLTAVYLQNEPQQVGPIRSARPFNIEVLPAFDGVLVFSGASIGVNQLLAQHNFGLIHEGYQGDLFYRGKDRKAPHNLYVGIPTVRQRMQALGWERPAALRGFSFSSECPARQPAARIDIPYPRSSTVAWTWGAGAGVYRRWVQGDPYTDLLTGQQVGCENVIVIYAKHWESDIVEDSRGATSIGIALLGGERVQIFRDGQVIEGTWWRKDANRLFQFIDDKGADIPLKPGHSWIQFVPTTYQLGIS